MKCSLVSPLQIRGAVYQRRNCRAFSGDFIVVRMSGNRTAWVLVYIYAVRSSKDKAGILLWNLLSIKAQYSKSFCRGEIFQNC